LDCPTEKKIGQATVSVLRDGHPYWTHIEFENGRITLGHEDARDLLYAMQRIVAYLDFRGV
jgi:hypothetical protein